MKVAIIGAGSSGLIALKYAIDAGHSCDVFEQTGSIGGTFVYTDNIDVDEHGFPVHTAMYKNLVVNLPKEIMSYSNFPYPEQENSFISQAEVLNYYENFAEHFNLKPHIQFYKYVKNIEPIQETKWRVTVQDLKTKTDVTLTYDAVFVCNGHYNSPIIPEIPGQDIFQGLQMHCYKYRTPNQFKGKKVLVIGSGPSGPDISVQILPVAKDVFLVVSQTLLCGDLPSNIITKPRVARLCANKAIFNDGTEEVVDTILYCTGYRYSIPFLADSCGITVEEKQVFPLFKHIVNIKHPTMFFIGLTNLCSLTIPIWDIQARFALATLEKSCLPSKEDMMKDFETDNLWRQENKIHSHHLHSGDAQNAYFQNLSDLSGIQNLPAVLIKIFEFHFQKNLDKRISYKILDNENFEHHYMN